MCLKRSMALLISQGAPSIQRTGSVPVAKAILFAVPQEGRLRPLTMLDNACFEIPIVSAIFE